MLRDLAALPGVAIGDNEVLYVMDSKCYVSKVGDRTNSQTATIPVAQLRHVLTNLFGDVGAKRAADPGSLKSGDLVLFFDGRSNATLMPELQKYTKSNPILRQRAIIPMRLVYHNREFSSNGHLAPRCEKAVHSRLPDPLETMYVVLHKSTVLQNRQRRYLDTPGDIRSRACANLWMKSPDESALSQVSHETAGLVFKQVLAQCAPADFADQDDFGDAGLPDEDPADEIGVSQGCNDVQLLSQEADASSPVLRLFPWEAPELQMREWLNLFGRSKDDKKRRVVDFAAGSGTAATAAARECYQYLGFVHNEKQKDIVQQAIQLRIVYELILNKRDGFEQTRFLSRERSLNGSDSGPLKDSKVAADLTKSKMADADQKFDSSSSSSSESSDDSSAEKKTGKKKK